MKIAIVGKGGSGKSTVSWLLTKYLAQIGTQVVAIDSDHNSDLVEHLHADRNNLNTIHQTHKEFKKQLGLPSHSSWQEVVNALQYNSFQLHPQDDYTALISHPIDTNTTLISTGLDNDDILFSDKCAHGHSAPLKYYLAGLEERDSWVIVDGVAGVDMINYGLYIGCHAVIVIVENHPNSLRVLQKISSIHNKISIPTFYIQNKFIKESIVSDANKLGNIAFSDTLLDYNFDHIDNNIKLQLNEIIRKLESAVIQNNTTLRTLEFEKSRYGIR